MAATLPTATTEKKLFGLFIWPEDDPIGGNIFNLSLIEHPRKDYADYKEGDQVKVKYPNYGLVPGIIARITEENGKPELKRILGSSVEFRQLVEDVLEVNFTEDTQQTELPSKSTLSGQPGPRNIQVKNKSTPTQPENKESHKSQSPRQKVNTPKRTSPRKKKQASQNENTLSSPTKKQREELTIISEDISNTELGSSPAVKKNKEIPKSQTPRKKPNTPKRASPRKKKQAPQNEDMSSSPTKKQKEDLKRISKEISYTELGSTCSLRHELPIIETPKRTPTTNNANPSNRRTSPRKNNYIELGSFIPIQEKPSSEVVGDSLRILTNDDTTCSWTSSQTELEKQEEVCKCKPQLKYLEDMVNQQRNNMFELHNRLTQCESSLQWAWQMLNHNVVTKTEDNAHRKDIEHCIRKDKDNCIAPTNCATNPDGFKSNHNDETGNNTSSATPLVDNIASATPLLDNTASATPLQICSDPADAVYNGFSKEQLEVKIQHEMCYKKGSTKLFRTMFNTEECKGRSLTGQASNKGVSRPALEDQHKLDVLRSIIKKKWSFTTTNMINTVIRDLLKPSRQK